MNNPFSTVVRLYPLPFREPAALACSDLPMGWAPLTVRLFGDLKVMSAEGGHEQGIVVRQIKEKFGTLRLYWSLNEQEDIRLDLTSHAGAGITVEAKGASPLYEAIRRRVIDAGRESRSTCQQCSRPGSEQSIYGWIATLCAGCGTRREAQMKSNQRGPSDGVPAQEVRRLVETVVHASLPEIDRRHLKDAAGRRYELPPGIPGVEIGALKVGDRMVCVAVDRDSSLLGAALVR